MKSSTVIVIGLVVVMVCCVVAICVLCITLGLVGSQTGGLDLGVPVETGKLAPDFQLINLDGEPVSLQEFRGQPILFNFWATWRGLCREEMSVIQTRYQ
jgi:cytochrome oxidase Cu insertion factor (SCO1/SenC/PrrC family)